MEVSSRGSNTTEFQFSRKWKGRDQHTSPERTKVSIEPNINKNKATGCCSERKVPVIYYLTRNGQLEHPHFMDVPLSSLEGLYLRDVINRLNVLRGKGMARLYTWSSKRSYKNGFVWHDLSENDLIHPALGQEYVLKGSELLDPSSINYNPRETASSSFRELKSADESLDFPATTRRRNQSWSSIYLNEYTIYKNEPNSESFRRVAADASTQTDDKRRRRRQVKVEADDKGQSQSQESYKNQSTELKREEISPPPSDSSPETLESLIKADGRLILCSGKGNDAKLNRTEDNYPSGRMKASTVLLQLISCGAISLKECGPSHAKDDGFSLIGHYKGRLPRGSGMKNETRTEKEICNYPRVRLEDKEYFSGSVIETNKKEDVPPALKRSNSYDADRGSSQLHLAEKETGGVRAKCLPRKPKGLPTKRENAIDGCGASCSNTQQLNMGTQDSKSNN